MGTRSRGVQIHERLDETVLGADGWPHDISEEDLLARPLMLKQEREPLERLEPGP
jgi:hypothetical protein